MKSNKISKNNNSNPTSSKPFFNKSGKGNFFTRSKEKDKPFFSPIPIQTKLTIGQPDDKYEQEADVMAEKVAQKLEKPSKVKSIQRKCEDCEKAKLQMMDKDAQKIEIMRKPIFESNYNSQFQSETIENQLKKPKGRGKSLSQNTKSEMESAFDVDFTHVRLHNDYSAIRMNNELNARAFTYGNDIYFNKNEYDEKSKEGKKLLAHELTHTIQQTGNKNVATKRKPNISAIGSPSIMRKLPFDGDLKIQYRLLRSREFEVTKKSLVVTATSDWAIDGGPSDWIPPNHYNVNLFKKKDYWIDENLGNCKFETKKTESKVWSNLSPGTYYLDIWTLNDNPHQILNGKISVSENDTDQDNSCELPHPPDSTDSILEILHTSLDLYGLIPALGVIPDAINAGIYSIEGDWVNAGISVAAMVPIFGQGATVTKLGIKVTRESVEKLTREGVEKAIKEGVEKAGTRVLKKANPQKVINALKNFSSKKFRTGSREFLLDKKGLKKILERHHPKYWNGTVKKKQSFFDDSMNIDDVVLAIEKVMNQNPGKLLKINPNAMGQIDGTWGGIKYVLGLNKGRIGQFYPL